MNHAILFNNHIIQHQRPGGVYRIATFLREQGWDIEVVEWAPLWDIEELKEFARSKITKHTLFCGFSCFFSFWDDKNDVFVKWLKQTYPHLKIVVGAGTKPIIASDDIDYFSYGFGENAVLAIAASLSGNSPGTGIKLDPAHFGSRTKIINANDYYPSFPLKSLMIKYEDRDYIDPNEWLSIEFGRGCIFECLFCNFPVLGVKGDYTRDADDFVLQLRDAHDRFGVTNYYAADETFNDRSDKITKFADAVEQLNFRPFFTGFIRADLMVSRPQDWDPLMRLGFMGHFYGIETFNHASGKAVGKGMHPAKLQDGILKAKDYFLSHDREAYRAIIALIVGLPHETKESIYQTGEWVKANWQGQAIDLNPLEIPVDEGLNKLSKLGKNYAKYGYTDLNEELYTNDGFQFNRGYGRKNLVWKNQHMDVNWARKFADEFFNDPKCPLALNPWALDWASHSGHHTIQDVMKADTLAINEPSRLAFHVRVRKYKALKLGTTVDRVVQDVPIIDFYSPSDRAERELAKKS